MLEISLFNICAYDLYIVFQHKFNGHYDYVITRVSVGTPHDMGIIWPWFSFHIQLEWLFCHQRPYYHNLGSGPLLHMACTSPISFNCFFFTITELINQCFHSWHLHIYIILPILFSTSKQENFHKPFEWYSTIKANTTHQYTSSFTFPLIIKLLHI